MTVEAARQLQDRLYEREQAAMRLHGAAKDEVVLEAAEALVDADVAYKVALKAAQVERAADIGNGGNEVPR